ncbi:MAG TPA: serine hydrolase domain-containing protein [Pyrinomonadaceae bacterium]|nr:serine hydrolase domain-containing protein [Pyrinomonadaceae bacterium]
MRRFVKFAAVLLTACCAAFPSAQDSASAACEFDATRDARRPGARGVEAELNKYLGRAAAESGFSGAVLVARGEKILIHGGYGWADLKKTSRVGKDTRFYIASISKQFAAAAVLKLEEQGRLSVRDSIGKFLKDVPADKSAITLHQLLTHTSGLGQNYAADGIADRDAAVRAVLKAPLKSPPGAQFRYSNDGYNLLAAIVEAASGQTYESFLRRRLLSPAGMSRTGFWGDATAKGDAPVAQTLKEIGENIRPPNWGFRGATGMVSTVEDLFKWWRALSTDKVLKRAGREKLLTPYVETPRGGYGYGWFASRPNQGRAAVWTTGAEDFGHNAIIKSYADGTLVIVASNAGNLSGVPARDVISANLERIIYNHEAARD